MTSLNFQMFLKAEQFFALFTFLRNGVRKGKPLDRWVLESHMLVLV